VVPYDIVCVCVFLEYQTMDKVQVSSFSNSIHHRQNPLTLIPTSVSFILVTQDKGQVRVQRSQNIRVT
jgi:hypothetical protein